MLETFETVIFKFYLTKLVKTLCKLLNTSKGMFLIKLSINLIIFNYFKKPGPGPGPAPGTKFGARARVIGTEKSKPGQSLAQSEEKEFREV